MSDLEFITDYRDIQEFRASFNELAHTVFDIDFDNWYRSGFWSDRYKCYSFADEGRIVANVSTSSMDIIICGECIKAIQIGTVMTHPGYRGKGLATRLMDKALEDVEGKCGLTFLFGVKNLCSFYSGFGFRPVKETQFHLPLNRYGHPAGSIRKMDFDDASDIGLLRGFLDERYPLSDTFRVENAGSITAWHCLNVFPQDLYHMPDYDSIVIYRGDKSKGILHLYDVISRDKADLARIAETLAINSVEGNVKEALFHFTPDTSLEGLEKRPYEPEDYIFFAKPSDAIPDLDFFFPYTAHA